MTLIQDCRKAGSRLCRIFLDALYPRVCPVCGEILTEPAPQNPYICPACYEKLLLPKEPRCLVCSRPVLDETDELCENCRRHIRYFDQGTALLLHDETAKKILYDLKYSNRRDHADMLAFEAARRFGGLIRRWAPRVMVPVPLYPKKENARGFNQAELLARRLSEHLKEQGIWLPVDACVLRRVRSTRAQKELTPSQRAENVKDAFQAVLPAPARRGPSGTDYRRILLVDDIYTTGATLSACALALKQAGAEEVRFLTFSIV